MDYQNLPPEQKQLIDAVDNFATLMKERLIEKANQGYTGWNNQYSSHDIMLAIEERLPRMLDKDDPVEIGLANWALINHLLKNK